MEKELRTATIVVKTTKSFKKEATEYAIKENRSLSSFIEKLLQDYIRDYDL